MLTIAFSFESGKYHATPWGSHVNEGAVEWPPSPWRICRALLATGFSKLGWNEDALPDAAKQLVDALAGVLPSYYLPPATVSHSRHYMPTRNSTTKVLDTFAHVGREPLLVFWPVVLESEPMRLLGQLLENLSYLGRAESWVSAQVVAHEADTPSPNTIPCTEKELGKPGHNQTAVLCPVPANTYLGWRTQAFEQALIDEGKNKKLTKAAKSKLAAAYPETLLDCLLSRTGVMQSAGWSQAPGSQKALYWIADDALVPARPATTVKASAEEHHQFALFALHSDTQNAQVLPLLSRALPQAEMLHDAVIRRFSDMFGKQTNCPVLTGKDEDNQPLLGHRHAHYLPVSLRGDGRIDHMVVYVADNKGLDIEAQSSLRAVRKTYSKGLDHTLFVTLTGLSGQKELCRALADAGMERSFLSKSAEWRSLTPFIAPRFLKKSGKNSIEGQIREELLQRGFDTAVEITAETGQQAAKRGFMDFVRARKKAERAPPSTVPWDVTFKFESPVEGPIALGYASHFGLGLFTPAALASALY